MSTLLSEVYVFPTSEPILEVPGRLSVSDEYYFMNGFANFAHL